MSCKRTELGAREFAIDNDENYEPARNEAFVEFMQTQMGSLVEDYLCEVDEETIPQMYTFIEFLASKNPPEEFAFKDRGDWLTDEYIGALVDCAEAKERWS